MKPYHKKLNFKRFIMLLTLNELSLQLLPPYSRNHMTLEIIPPMQLFSRLMDLCKVFVKEGDMTSNHGLLDFLLDYYNKKHPQSYEKALGS